MISDTPRKSTISVPPHEGCQEVVVRSKIVNANRGYNVLGGGGEICFLVAYVRARSCNAISSLSIEIYSRSHVRDDLAIASRRGVSMIYSQYLSLFLSLSLSGVI